MSGVHEIGQPLQAKAELPTFLTPIVGRTQELAAICDLLRDERLRLLTLTGSGGVGKTRLAVSVASAMTGEFPDGIVFVALASVSSADLVPGALAQALGVLKDGDGPLLGRVRRFLESKRLLLILDSFEHVLAAGPVVGDLLTTRPGLTVLATSQASLRISGEQEFQVPPLSLPKAERLSVGDVRNSDAVVLFAQRARSARADFSLSDQNAPAVAEICRRLDGLPLAIELAAARIKVLSPQALMSRLERRLQVLTGGPRDQPARLQAVRSAITWSHDLLTDEEQRLFRCLSVFADGLTLEAAEYVAGETDAEATPVLDLLQSLVDKCLVRRLAETDDSTARFAMFETIREFAVEALAASGEDDGVRRRHAEFFAALAETNHDEFYGAGDLYRHDVLAADQANLRSAIETSLARGWGDVARALAGALAPFWFVRGQAEEGRRWLAAALAHPAAGGDAIHARALFGAGILAWQQGDFDTAVTHHTESLTISRAIGDPGGMARANFGLGDVARVREEYVEAASRYEEALETFRDLDDRVWIAFTLPQSAEVARHLGDREGASSLLVEAIGLGRSVGMRLPVAEALSHDGDIAWEEGDLTRATVQFQQSARVYWELGERFFVLNVLQALGCIAAELGLSTAAATLLGAVDAALTSRRPPNTFVSAANFARRLGALRANLREPAFTEAWNRGQRLTLVEAFTFAMGPDFVFEAAEPPVKQARSAETTLTDRELEVLPLLVAGLTDREIAAVLFISPRTVQVHVGRILTKLGVNGRTAAVAAAIRMGLVAPGETPSA